MSALNTLKITIAVAAGLVASFLLLGAVLGQLIGLSYVETGSISPTMEAGDGFVTVPMAFADGVIIPTPV
jgi:signal peptidase